MTENDGLPSLAVIASQYETFNTLYVSTVNQMQRILKANPDRWYVQFQALSGGIYNSPLMPGPAILNVPSAPITRPEWEWKYKDAPSIVTGEFYMNMGVGAQILITEVVYEGR